MEYHLMIVYIFVCVLSHVFGGELTFELPDNEKQCFFEQIDKGVKCTLEFQVITGGQYDVDMELTSPSGQILYKDVKKQYDTFTWTSDQSGVYKFCFSNEFSTFSHKVVYFDFQVGDEKPLVEGDNQHATAMTMMETMSYGIHESLSDVSDQQTYFKNREASGRLFAESLNERVMYWSIGESIIVLLVGIGQVFILRSFFQEKKSIGGVPITS